MNVKRRHPLDWQASPKNPDVNNVVEKTKNQRFNDSLKLRLLALSAEGTRNTCGNKSGKKNQKRYERL